MLGVRKSDGIPEHKTLGSTHECKNEKGDKVPPKVSVRLKSCEPLYMCPQAPLLYGDEGTFTF
jgi:hypothetical protein